MANLKNHHAGSRRGKKAEEHENIGKCLITALNRYLGTCMSGVRQADVSRDSSSASEIHLMLERYFQALRHCVQ